MVVDKYVSRCLDVGSTPTGSIIPLHSFAFLGKNVVKSTFFIFVFGIPWHSFAKKGYNKGYNIFVVILEIYVLRKAFSDVILCLLSYVSINVHGCFQVRMA